MVQPVTISTALDDDGDVKLAADVDALVDCATTLWLGIADTAGAMDEGAH